jgi:small GTP-binding protein
MNLAKVVFLGNCQVGKSCLVNSLLGKAFGAVRSTIGGMRSSLDVEMNGQKRTIDFWDTAGQERYRSVMPLHFRGTHIAVFVFDQTEKDSLATLTEWNSLLSEWASPHVTKIIVGNKYDLLEGIGQEEMSLAAERIGATACLRTSAATGFGVRDLLDEIRSVMFGPSMSAPHTEGRRNVIGSRDGCSC